MNSPYGNSPRETRFLKQARRPKEACWLSKELCFFLGGEAA